MVQIKISGREDTQINIIASSRSYPSKQDYWDGNWLDCEIKIIVLDLNFSFTSDQSCLPQLIKQLELLIKLIQ